VGYGGVELVHPFQDMNEWWTVLIDAVKGSKFLDWLGQGQFQKVGSAP
jgi:hypothetical protein